MDKVLRLRDGAQLKPAHSLSARPRGPCKNGKMYATGKPCLSGIMLAALRIPYLLAAGALAKREDVSHKHACGAFPVYSRHSENKFSRWRAHTEKAGYCRLTSSFLRRDRDSNPGRLFTSTVFKTAAIDHSAISPNWVAKIDLFPISAKKVTFYQSPSNGRGLGKRLRR